MKQAARELLATLKRERLVLDWRKRQQTRARVKLVIEQTLYERLPSPTYSLVEVTAKTDAVYQHVYDAYQGAGQSVYGSSGYAA